jgi:glycosyltransferase involved in cell wall biosynthesis
MNEAEDPIVSVLIPTHNRSQELTIAVESVLNQSFSSFEVLILDDASTEDIGGVAKMFNDPRIHYIRNNQKTNANVLRNIGISKAKGRFIAFLDSDDEWLPDHLLKKITYLQEHSVDMIFGSSFIDNGIDRVFMVSRDLYDSEHPINYILGNGFAQTSSWVLKSSCAKEILFDETLLRHQDYDFFIRFALKFTARASWEPTSVIHWKQGVPRFKNLESEKQFIQRYEEHLEVRHLCKYFLLRYYGWKDLNEPEGTAFYRQRILKKINFITFNQFRQLFKNNSSLLLPIRLLHFTSLILLHSYPKSK